MKKSQEKYNFGWSFFWMNGYWIVGTIVLLIAIWLLISLSFYQILGLILVIVSINLFGGSYVCRKSSSLDYLTLPYTDLLSSDKDYVLDACCGAGRTTIALSKVIREGRIVALDRFDASYIDGGGRQLLEDNLKIAKIDDKVEIVKGDVTNLNFEENTFDAIISSYALDHIGPLQSTALKEFNRVLKPEGRFLLIVFVPNFYTFLVANVMCFHLTSRKKWRKMFSNTGFETLDEGIINGGVYYLLKKSTK